MNKVLLMLLVLSSANTLAAVSKWVDAQGQVHYSDRPPPPEVKAEKLHSAPDADSAAGATAPATPKTFAEREVELKKAQKAKQEAADKTVLKQTDAEAKKASCTTAQQNLKALQDGVRIIELDAHGERSYIDDQQRQQRIAKTQQDVSTYCK